MSETALLSSEILARMSQRDRQGLTEKVIQEKSGWEGDGKGWEPDWGEMKAIMPAGSADFWERLVLSERPQMRVSLCVQMALRGTGDKGLEQDKDLFNRVQGDLVAILGQVASERRIKVVELTAGPERLSLLALSRLVVGEYVEKLKEGGFRLEAETRAAQIESAREEGRNEGAVVQTRRVSELRQEIERLQGEVVRAGREREEGSSPAGVPPEVASQVLRLFEGMPVPPEKEQEAAGFFRQLREALQLGDGSLAPKVRARLETAFVGIFGEPAEARFAELVRQLEGGGVSTETTAALDFVVAVLDGRSELSGQASTAVEQVVALLRQGEIAEARRIAQEQLQPVAGGEATDQFMGSLLVAQRKGAESAIAAGRGELAQQIEGLAAEQFQRRLDEFVKDLGERRRKDSRGYEQEWRTRGYYREKWVGTPDKPGIFTNLFGGDDKALKLAEDFINRMWVSYLDGIGRKIPPEGQGHYIAIPDEVGQKLSDIALREVSARLKSAIHGACFVYKYGRDELRSDAGVSKVREALLGTEGEPGVLWVLTGDRALATTMTEQIVAALIESMRELSLPAALEKAKEAGGRVASDLVNSVIRWMEGNNPERVMEVLVGTETRPDNWGKRLGVETARGLIEPLIAVWNSGLREGASEQNVIEKLKDRGASDFNRRIDEVMARIVDGLAAGRPPSELDSQLWERLTGQKLDDGVMGQVRNYLEQNARVRAEALK